MKRILAGLVLALAFSVAPSFALTCALNTTCTAAEPCAVNTAGNWDCGRVPTSADTWSIPANKYGLVTADFTLDGTSGTISGILAFQQNTSWRTNGFGTMTVTCRAGTDITIASGGLFMMRAGDRIKFDSTNANCSMVVSSGGKLDIEGTISEHRIRRIVTTTDHANCDGTDGISGGRKYVITLDSWPGGTPEGSLAGRRILFVNGAAKARQYEIMTTTMGTDIDVNAIAVCTDFKDSLSTQTGQRLTPHATLAARTRPSATNLHRMPAPGPAALCTGADQPTWYGGCTGAAAGQIVEALPAVGDTVRIIQDAHIVESAGSLGINVYGVAINPLPTIIGLNMGGNPSATHNSNDFLSFSAGANGLSMGQGRFAYNNIHDNNHAITFGLIGVQDTEFFGNAIHDDGTSVSNAQGAMYIGGYNGTTRPYYINDNKFYLNQFFRTKGNALCPGYTSDTGYSTGIEIYDNLMYQGCVSGSTECSGIELAYLDGAKVHDNMVFDHYNADNDGIGISVHGSMKNSAIYFNWVVNEGFVGIGTDTYPVTSATNSYVNNYVSTVVGAAFRARGRYYSNIARNSFMFSNSGNSALGVFHNPDYMASNFIIPTDDTLLAAADCTGGDYCARIGIGIDSSATAPYTPTVVDLAIAGFGSSSESQVIRMITGTAGITASHVTFDGHCRATGHESLWDNRGGSPAASTLTDFAIAGGGDLYWARGNNSTSASYTYVRRSPTTACKLVVPGTSMSADTTTGIPDMGYVGPLQHNFNLTKNSTLRGAGSSGDAVGIRVFRFNHERIAGNWGKVNTMWDATGMTMTSAVTFDGEQPVDITDNGTSADDTDGDGVLDLYDNCDRNPNPSQLDTDADGAGDACDP